MLKALLKKQFLETTASFRKNRKTGKLRSGAGAAAMGALYVGIFILLAVCFFVMAMGLCEPLCAMGLAWLYFAIFGMLSLIMGVFGSVFTTYQSLYRAKDNDLLLSMPIPAGYIVLVRLLSVWFWGAVYTLPVWAGSAVAYQVITGNLSSLWAQIVVLLLETLLVLGLTCILGYLVALVASKIKKNKSLITTAASLAFLGIYYFFYFRFTEIGDTLLANAAGLGEQVRDKAGALYVFGRAMEGSLPELGLTALVILAFFTAVVWVLSRSLLRLSIVEGSSSSDGSAKKTEIRGAEKTSSLRMALLRREWQRLLSSSVYMMNCCLGTVLLPLSGILLLFKGQELAAGLQEDLLPILEAAGLTGLVPLIGAGILCFVGAMNDSTAPSVSLEGKHLWVIRSMPVEPKAVLRAKLDLHLLLTLPGVLVAGICLGVVLRCDWRDLLLMAAAGCSFTLLFGVLGLTLNLKMPNLTWTNEVYPVKQSAPVALTLLGGGAFIILLGVVYYLLWIWVDPRSYLAGCTAVMLLTFALLQRWIDTRGAAIFGSL